MNKERLLGLISSSHIVDNNGLYPGVSYMVFMMKDAEEVYRDYVSIKRYIPITSKWIHINTILIDNDKICFISNGVFYRKLIGIRLDNGIIKLIPSKKKEWYTVLDKVFQREEMYSNPNFWENFIC